MSAIRFCAMLAALSLIALATVYMRAEQTRCTVRTLAIESELIRERREFWRLQAVVARLQTPGHIRDRMEWFESDLAPAGSIRSFRSTGRLASTLGGGRAE